MPTKIEKDSVTGRETTGQEWDGIRELNTPLPRWWLYTFYATILWSLVYFVLFPAVPLWSGHTAGLLGWSSREQLGEQLERAEARKAGFLEAIRARSPEEIVADPTLFDFARAGGAAAFADNCAACHGAGGAGQQNYPVLADDAWLWGGTLQDIETTLLHGIRWTEDPETRIGEMPSFGEGILELPEAALAADHILSLSGQGRASEEGAAIFADNCAACHGEQAEGTAEMGAPSLSDRIWLYGGRKEDIVAQVLRPKHGVMPAWGDRLGSETLKMLTVYVHSLGGGQ